MPSNNPDLPIWLAPAKINLFLHVVGKRSDGYHELQTIFQFLDFADEMSFSVNLDGELERSYDFGFNRASDLNLCAATALRDFVGRPEAGVRRLIWIKKYLWEVGLVVEVRMRQQTLIAPQSLMGPRFRAKDPAGIRVVTRGGCACLCSWFFSLGGRNW